MSIIENTRILLFLVLSIICFNGYAACVGLGCNCSISTSTFNFGIYDAFSNSPTDATGTLSVTCGGIVLGLNISYIIHLSTGVSGTYSARTLQGGVSALSYNFYVDAARTTVWGNGSASTGFRSNSYLLNLIFSRTDNFTIYGRIPSLQNVNAGTYSDTIVGTVVF